MVKKIFYIIIIALLSLSSLKSQTTSGTEFWLTFGRVTSGNMPSNLDIQIRIATNNLPASVTIYFTHLDVSETFTIPAYEVFTYDILDTNQKNAVYNTTTGITDYSIYISSSEEVSVYTCIGAGSMRDATNVLPVTALGTEYYQISYTPYSCLDAYAVIATEDNTSVSYNGETPIMLDAGEVYYRASTTDMTGSFITANNPVAFFAVNQLTAIPSSFSSVWSSLMQQLAPVKTWDNTFFVPVTIVGQEFVRIVASQNNTEITTLSGGTVQFGVPGAQTDITNLQAGEWVELEISNTGCYIEADKPIGVCSYMRTFPPPTVLRSLPAQAWVPGIKQTVFNALIASFNVWYFSSMDHRALILTPTATKGSTMVSIGGAAPVPLYGGEWIENTTADISFYSMPMTHETESYIFSNPKGMIIFGYGVSLGAYNSYYYLAGSSMRDLTAAFFANGVGCEDMKDYLFCENEITFTTIISNIAEVDSLKWYRKKISGTPDPNYILITEDDVEVEGDFPLEWTRRFSAGNYMIKLDVYHGGDPNPDPELSCEGELCIGVWIKTIPVTSAGGTVSPAVECYKVGSKIELRSLPH